jgi:spore maturation protein CgeB
MKLFRLTSYYTAYIQDFFSRHPDLEGESYARQKAAIDYDAFGEGDFWSQALTPLGYEVMEVAANIEPLQKAWAGERGLAFAPDRWLLDIVLAQIEEFQPEILFIDDYSTFSRRWITDLRQVCPSIRLVLGWCGAPFHAPSVFQAYDVVLSCIPELVERFRAMGHKSFHLNHAFEPRLLDRLTTEPQDIEFSFIGSINRGKGSHSRREELLLDLAKQLPIKIYTPNVDRSLLEEIKTLARGTLFLTMEVLRKAGIPNAKLTRLPKIGKAASWSYRPLCAINPRLRPLVKPAVFGLEMYLVLKRSKLTFNNHIDISVNSASNKRLFEATGVGTCLLTDWKDNLAELFEPGKEVVTYSSAAECLEKARWLLGHTAERQAIARAGQARTLRDHTFAQRAAQLDDIIKLHLR